LWTFVAGGGFGVALVGLKIFPILVIGGLDSLPGTIVAAMLIGIFESLGAGYLDPQLGPGFGTISCTCCCWRCCWRGHMACSGWAPARRV
jgi:branched-subunit amino acid ABC-type transport system permease component